MKRKKLDRYSWRRRGHRRRFSGENIQKDKPSVAVRAIIFKSGPDEPYDPKADPLVHRNSLRNAKPFSRQEALDLNVPTKYNQVSVEKRAVELRFRELQLKMYVERTHHHRVEDWSCMWLSGRADSAISIRVLFYGDRAMLIKYDQGLLLRSSIFPGLDLAITYFNIEQTHGTGIAWFKIDEPLPQEEQQPLPRGMGNAANPLKDFDVEEGKPTYAPTIGKGQLRNNKHLLFSTDALTKKPKE